MLMFTRDQFNSHLDDILKCRYIIFGEMHDKNSRTEIYSYIDSIINRGYNIALVAEELLENVIIKSNYDYYLKVAKRGMKGINGKTEYIGWSDDAIKYCMEHDIDLYGMERYGTEKPNDSKLSLVKMKDEELSKHYNKPIFSNIFKYRENHFYRNIVKIKGYDKIVGIVGDSHLRTIRTTELGASSYLIKNFRFNKDVCFIRQPKESREID